MMKTMFAANVWNPAYDAMSNTHIHAWMYVYIIFEIDDIAYDKFWILFDFRN